MSNPRWALIVAGIQFFVFWWLISDAAESGRMVNVIPGALMGVAVLMTVEGWLKLSRISRREARQ